LKSIYHQKSHWKIALLLVALLIGGASLYYTNSIVAQIETEERAKIKLWADAQKKMLELSFDEKATEATDLNFYFEIVQNNQNIPVILTDENYQVIGTVLVDTARGQKYVNAELATMRQQNPPIVNEYSVGGGSGFKNYIFYKDSNLLYQLRYYPVFQLLVIGLFVATAYFAFSTSRRYEQNYLWVGMAKETAHQLGTPISSLMAWQEVLKTYDTTPEVAEALIEIDHDLTRLTTIAERFSKIGSVPDLQLLPAADTMRQSVAYLRSRVSERSVKFTEIYPENIIYIHINPALFDWVVENLIKNAVDAMGGTGQIVVQMTEKPLKKQLYIDISDTGKGIAAAQFANVFKAGFSTKKRGWGLGLTLTKRIVESYHKGKIFVQKSELNKGTTFRIILPLPKNTDKTSPPNLKKTQKI
jgi:signal transduction histidine kinase